MGYATRRPRECPTEERPCVQRQQDGKDDTGDQQNSRPHSDVALGKHAGQCLSNREQQAIT
jgi:hypothetical protein